jgi:hypothetical protein
MQWWYNHYNYIFILLKLFLFILIFHVFHCCYNVKFIVFMTLKNNSWKWSWLNGFAIEWSILLHLESPKIRQNIDTWLRNCNFIDHSMANPFNHDHFQELFFSVIKTIRLYPRKDISTWLWTGYDLILLITIDRQYSLCVDVVILQYGFNKSIWWLKGYENINCFNITKINNINFRYMQWWYNRYKVYYI